MSKPDARLLVRQKAKRKTALRTNFLSMALKQISQRWNMSSFLLFLYLVLSFLSVTHYIVCFPPQKTFDSLQSAWCDVRRATSTKKVFPLSIFPLKKAQQLQMQHKGRSFSKDVELSFVVLGICPSVSLSSPPSAAFSTVMCFLYTPSSLFFFFFTFLILLLLQMTMSTSCTQNHYSHMKAFSKVHNFQYIFVTLSLFLIYLSFSSGTSK